MHISASAALIRRRASPISAGRSASVSPAVGIGSRTRTSTSLRSSRRRRRSERGLSGEQTTGTSGAPVCSAIWNPPFLNGSIAPGVRLRVPSGKIHTATRRSRIAASASFSRPTALCVLARSIRMFPVTAYSQPKKGILRISFLAMTTEPGAKHGASAGTSSVLWWLAMKTHGRKSRSRSGCVTVVRIPSGGPTHRASRRA